MRHHLGHVAGAEMIGGCKQRTAEIGGVTGPLQISTSGMVRHFQ
jgi:hypothetical protein